MHRITLQQPPRTRPPESRPQAGYAPPPPPPPRPVYRCAYCGRPLTNAATCPGCGAAR